MSYCLWVKEERSHFVVIDILFFRKDGNPLFLSKMFFRENNDGNMFLGMIYMIIGCGDKSLTDLSPTDFSLTQTNQGLSWVRGERS